eukprot:6634934-Pyramimonas_sp.AAC.1
MVDKGRVAVRDPLGLVKGIRSSRPGSDARCSGALWVARPLLSDDLCHMQQPNVRGAGSTGLVR